MIKAIIACIDDVNDKLAAFALLKEEEDPDEPSGDASHDEFSYVPIPPEEPGFQGPVISY